MAIKSFETLEDMFAEIEKNNAEADARVTFESSQFQPGSYYARFMPSLQLIIYGKIVDPVQQERLAGATPMEISYTRDLYYKSSHMKHVRATESFSAACPDGEPGDVHVSTMNVPLSAVEFSRARDLGWPTSIQDFWDNVMQMEDPTKRKNQN
jgi:hypothetical protein